MATATKPPSLETLGRISAFVLNRAASDCRLELYEYLVELALYESKTSKEMTKGFIISSIEKDLGVKQLPVNLIDSATERLHKKGAVKRVRGKKEDLYFLTQDEKTRIALMKEQYSQFVAQVQKELGQRIKKSGILLDLGQEVIVFTTFRNFLANVLSRLGMECCFALIGSYGKDARHLKPVNIKQILDDILETVEDEALRKAERQTFVEYISNPDDALSDLLYSLAQSYFFIQILQLDPECQSLTAERLQRKRVYLDTNVIHHSLTGRDRRNKAVDDALKLTMTLGITLVLSKETKEEFLSLVGNRRRVFGKKPEIPKVRFKKTVNKLEDGFLKDFLQKKDENPNLTFDRYADRLEEIDTLMKNRYSAVFDENEYKEIFENTDMPHLKEIVVKEGTKFGLFKNDKVAEHDAFHILLVQDLRKKDKGDILGPNYWFLTHDRSLLFVEKRFGKYKTFPSSIFVDNWVQLISPLVSPKLIKNARDTYISLFASRLPILSRTVDEEVYLAFQGKWMDDEDLSPEDVARIIGNRYIKDYYERSKEVEKPILAEDKQKMLKPVIAEIKKQRRETAWMKRDIKKLQEETGKLQEEISSWKRISKRQRNILSKLGHIFGAGLFLVLWYFLYEFFVEVHTVEHWAAFFCSMLLAASVGAIADIFGYRWLLDRLLRYKFPKKEISS